MRGIIAALLIGGVVIGLTVGCGGTPNVIPPDKKYEPPKNPPNVERQAGPKSAK